MTRLQVIKGDITTRRDDAIVFESDDLTPGQAVLDSELTNPRYIQVKGPTWTGGQNGEPGLLFSAYYNAVKVAAENGLKTISFPSISTGIYGYPIEDAAEMAIAALLEALADYLAIEQVTIVTFSNADFEVFSEAVEGLFD